MALQPFVGPWSLLQFRNLFYTDGRTPWTNDQLVARTLTWTQDNTNTEQTHTQTSIAWVGFEPTIPVFERAKTVLALGREHTKKTGDAVSSICAVPFSNMCWTQANNNSRKLRLLCACQFSWCAFARRPRNVNGKLQKSTSNLSQVQVTWCRMNWEDSLQCWQSEGPWEEAVVG
jgi:hypothetical protein